MIEIKKGSIIKETTKDKFEKTYSKFGWEEVKEKPKPLKQVKEETKKEEEITKK